MRGSNRTIEIDVAPSERLQFDGVCVSGSPLCFYTVPVQLYGTGTVVDLGLSSREGPAGRRRRQVAANPRL